MTREEKQRKYIVRLAVSYIIKGVLGMAVFAALLYIFFAILPALFMLIFGRMHIMTAICHVTGICGYVVWRILKKEAERDQDAHGRD